MSQVGLCQGFWSCFRLVSGLGRASGVVAGQYCGRDLVTKRAVQSNTVVEHLDVLRDGESGTGLGCGMYTGEALKRPGFRSGPTEGGSEHAQEVHPRTARAPRTDGLRASSHRGWSSHALVAHDCTADRRRRGDSADVVQSLWPHEVA